MSPGGLYDTLRPDIITATKEQRDAMRKDPTLVVSFKLFEKNQFPYMEVRRPFILGLAENQWKPTLAHFFIKVLHDKGKLKRLYTQNIDGLDFQTGLEREKIVNVHGSIAEISCEFCGDSSLSSEEFIQAVKTKIKV